MSEEKLIKTLGMTDCTICRWISCMNSMQKVLDTNSDEKLLLNTFVHKGGIEADVARI